MGVFVKHSMNDPFLIVSQLLPDERKIIVLLFPEPLLFGVNIGE